MKTFKIVAVVVLAVFVSACRIDIIIPEGGRVVTESGAYSCGPGQRCSIDVVDVFFDETFDVVPSAGYEFRGWVKRDRGLCGGQSEPCRLFTSGFSGNDALMAILESEEVFYLQPNFARIGSDDRSERGPRITFRQLDKALAEREVSTATPNGIWILYGEGKQLESLDEGATVFETRVDLVAAVVRIFDRVPGDPSLISLNNLYLDSPAGEQRYSFRWPLVVGQFLAAGVFVTAGDDVNGANESAVYATLKDNRTLTFENQTLVDDDGNVTGSFEVRLRARKISSDYDSPIGSLGINDMAYDIGRYIYYNYARSLFMSDRPMWDYVYTGFYVDGRDVSGDPVFGAVSYEHNEGLLYSGPSTVTPDVASAFWIRADVATDDARGTETKTVNVTSQLPDDVLNVDLAIEVDLGLDVDFDVRETDGEEAFTGSITTNLER